MDRKERNEVLSILSRATKIHAEISLDSKTLPLFGRQGNYMGSFPRDRIYQMEDEGRVSIDTKGAHQI
jgi:hypothetical protein